MLTIFQGVQIYISRIDNLQQLIKHISSKLASTQAPHDLPHSPAANGHHAQDQLMQVERGDQPSNSSCVQQLSHNETLHTSFRPSPNSHQSKRVHSPSCSRNSFTKETHLPLHINSESDENHFSMVASSSSPTDASNHSRQSPHSCRQTHQWNRGLKRLPMTDGHNSSTRRRLNGNFDKESPLGPQLQAPSLPGRTGSPSSHNRSLHLETSGSEISLTSQLMEEGEVSDCSIEGTSSVSLGHNVHRDSNAGRHLIAYGQDSRNSPTQHCLHSPLHYHTHSTGHGRQKTPSRAQHTIPSHHKDNSSHKQNSDRSPHHSRLYHNSSRDRYSYKH